MPRPSLLGALRRSREAGAEPASPAHAVRRTAPPPAELRRERKLLLRAREDRIRDLGGLVLEMYRRDDFRESVLFDCCAEIAGIEERVRELDLVLETRRPPATRCVCGAPLLSRSHFCASCGRAVGRGAVPACTSCGRPLAADARFCAACGTPAGDAREDARAAEG